MIGHRGAPRLAKENTVEAFRAAAAAGADMVELDVRRTADGALVVHHDAALEDGRVIVETLAGDLPDWLPSLSDALNACEGMEVNVEIKNALRDPDYDATDDIARATADEVERIGWTDRVLVSSFNLSTVNAIRARVRTAWLTLFDDSSALDAVVGNGHVAWHPHERAVTRDAVDAAHARGIRINTWTVDDVDRMRELRGWGVDGIVTNDVVAAVAALRHD